MANYSEQEMPHPAPQPRMFYGYVIIIAAFFVIFAAYGVRFSFGVYFKPMAEDLLYNSATTASAFSLSMFLEGIFSLVMGGLADRFGPRIILTASAILVGAGYCLMPMVHSTWQLYLFYGVIIGVGMGGIFVPMISMTARWFTARRSLMTGLVSGGAGIGTLVMPPLSAHLIESFGWRTTFVIMGIMILVVSLVAAQFLKRDPSKIGLLPYGENPQSGTGKAVAAGGFTFQQALRLPQFWVIFAMIVFYGFYSSAVNVHIVPDAINNGMSSTTAASILAVSGGLVVIGRVILGTAADRTDNRRIFIFGFILSSIALVWIILMQAHFAFFVFAVLIGFAQGGLGTSQSPLVAGVFGLKSHGLIYGAIGFGYTLGAALGPFVTGYLFDVTRSYNLALIICAGTSVVSLLIAFFVRPVKSAIFSSSRV